MMFLFITFIIETGISNYDAYVYKSLSLLIISLIGFIYGLRKIREQMKIQNEELQVRLPKESGLESETEGDYLND